MRLVIVAESECEKKETGLVIIARDQYEKKEIRVREFVEKWV